jgi:hypothetical protein
MSIKTITKIACFVIPLLYGAGCSNTSYGGGEHAEMDFQNAGFLKAEIVARISSKEINESSGLAASKCQADVFWTHNDSGDGPFIYAFNSKGKPLGTFRLPNVSNIDWEDIATVKTSSGECFVYIGEIGDNERRRDEHQIYRLSEPVISSSKASSRKNPIMLPGAEILRFRYPDERYDAEALLVEPATQTIFVITKQFNSQAKVFEIRPQFDDPEIQTAAKTAEISLPSLPNGLVTGGDISPDGKYVVLCDYYAGYLFSLPKSAKDFSEIWKQKPAAFDLGPRDIGEAVAFGDDVNTIFATTEHLNAPLIRVIRRQK